jgi:hypothetical protein
MRSSGSFASPTSSAQAKGGPQSRPDHRKPRRRAGSGHPQERFNKPVGRSMLASPVRTRLRARGDGAGGEGEANAWVAARAR